VHSDVRIIGPFIPIAKEMARESPFGSNGSTQSIAESIKRIRGAKRQRMARIDQINRT
jgi:hypothetical protein